MTRGFQRPLQQPGLEEGVGREHADADALGGRAGPAPDGRHGLLDDVDQLELGGHQAVEEVVDGVAGHHQQFGPGVPEGPEAALQGWSGLCPSLRRASCLLGTVGSAQITTRTCSWSVAAPVAVTSLS